MKLTTDIQNTNLIIGEEMQRAVLVPWEVAGVGPEKLEQLEMFTEKFLEMKKEILGDLNRVKDIGEELHNISNEGSKDDADLSLLGHEEILNYKLIGRSTFLLKKIDESLLKIKNGTFGICEDCGAEIGFNRLKARPMAKLCIECKEGEERMEHHIPYTVKSHTLGSKIHISKSERIISEGQAS